MFMNNMLLVLDFQEIWCTYSRHVRTYITLKRYLDKTWDIVKLNYESELIQSMCLKSRSTV